MSIGEKLYLLRTELGLTQKEFADQIHASQSAVNFWEKNKRIPRIGVLDTIAKVFNVPIDYFISTDELSKYKLETDIRLKTDLEILNALKKTKCKTPEQKIQYNNLLESIQKICSENLVVHETINYDQDKNQNFSERGLELLEQLKESTKESAALAVSQGRELLESINKLNEEGQQKVKEYADDLAENSKYRKDISDET